MIWSGFAFENVVRKHISQIKQALGINGIITQEYAWLFQGNSNQKGAQIDLVIDRSDNCINLLEIKFCDTELSIDKNYAEQLRQKIAIFKEQTPTKKNIFLTFLTTFGVKKNKYYLSLNSNQIKLENLFEDVREIG